MTQTEHKQLREYENLLQDFVSGRVSASAFQAHFLKTLKDDPNLWEGDVYSILETIFEEAEAFEEDSEVRDDSMIAEAELLNAAQASLRRLRKFTQARV